MSERTWDSGCKWHFGPAAGVYVGINDAGIGIFRKTPYPGLAREILQNVIDAKDPDVKGPAKAVFELVKIPKSQFPCPSQLSEVITRCHQFYPDGDDGAKTARLEKAAKKWLDNEADIPVLKISDYNTTGLTGVKEKKGSNWTGLVKESGATNKGSGQSGSFGVGKFAPFNLSCIRTIIYSTKNKDGEIAIQGKTILTTFEDDQGIERQHIGLFGESDGKEGCKPIYDPSKMPELFRREDTGTDLFILAFKDEPEWMDLIAKSVLDDFFYTIWKGNLEVSIVDRDASVSIDINKETLAKWMKVYEKICGDKNYKFDAPAFWNILTAPPNERVYCKEVFIDDKKKARGEYELYFRLDPDSSERRILEMRAPGMKIKEDSGFRMRSGFLGIFIATGSGCDSPDTEPDLNLNIFLRKCENQAHNDWSEDEYEEDPKKARGVIRTIHNTIRQKILEEIPQCNETKTDAFGMADFLPSLQSNMGGKMEEDAFRNYEPMPAHIMSSSSKTTMERHSYTVAKKSTHNDQIQEDTYTPDEDSNENIATEGKTSSNNKPKVAKMTHVIPGINENCSNNQGSNVNREIKISNIKAPYDETTDSFRISFVPKESADNVNVRLRIGADDENSRPAEINSVKQHGHNLKCNSKSFEIPHVDKDTKVVITVKLLGVKRCPLEVKAYAE